MLPIYKALEVKQVISANSGHTQPWVVLASTPDGVKPFVVKLYTTSQVDQSHCVTKEVICNLLAGEFELNVPKCVLIDIPDDLVSRLSFDNQQQYSHADYRLKFATHYLDSVNSAMKGFESKFYKERISMDTLFAFDNLIRNGDRGQNKTNLLFRNKEAFLIDHEMTLNQRDIVNINLNTHQLEDVFTKYHLFFQNLKNAKDKSKVKFFKDFSDNLTFLSVNKFTPYHKQLIDLGFIDYSQPINSWLNNVIQNSTIFVNKLKGVIQ